MSFEHGPLVAVEGRKGMANGTCGDQKRLQRNLGTLESRPVKLGQIESRQLSKEREPERPWSAASMRANRAM